MKPCYYCNGRKFKYLSGKDLRTIVQCEKCGNEIKTPHLTLDSARGFWNMKMAVLKKNEKKNTAAG